MSWRYRDSLTGRWVSEETYLRSTSHGGTQYHRESDADYGRHEQGGRADTVDDWYDTTFDPGDFDEDYGYDEFDGGADYGETE